ncbi:MAG: sporulation initiation factor Spo0A C-terminal domain-containing protein [Eubacteriales bacterium]|nr:sporulation initiation factor Spo0A C-terminal domain-containing protein [Eubacteriales bacterium]
MQSMIQVMIADEDSLFTRLIRHTLQPSDGFSVTGVYRSCDQLLEAVQRENPDVLLLDPMLPGGNALLLLRQLNQLPAGQHPHVFVISSFTSAEMTAECNRLGVSFFLRKPVNANTIADLISTCVRNTSEPVHRPTDHEIQRYITKILNTLQFPTHVLGYYYVRDCIMLALRHNTPTISVTKVVYPSVAKANSTTWTSVERDIRSGILIAWDRCDGHFPGFSSTRRPTNRAFISAVAERVRCDLQIDFA